MYRSERWNLKAQLDHRGINRYEDEDDEQLKVQVWIDSVSVTKSMLLLLRILAQWPALHRGQQRARGDLPQIVSNEHVATAQNEHQEQTCGGTMS
jgi:hypothetical protein